MFSILNEIKENSPRRTTSVVIASNGTAAAIYLLVAITGYLSFGNNIAGNIVAQCSYPPLLPCALVILPSHCITLPLTNLPNSRCSIRSLHDRQGRHSSPGNVLLSTTSPPLPRVRRRYHALAPSPSQQSVLFHVSQPRVSDTPVAPPWQRQTQQPKRKWQKRTYGRDEIRRHHDRHHCTELYRRNDSD